MPINAARDVLGTAWGLLVLGDLICGNRHFRDCWPSEREASAS